MAKGSLIESPESSSPVVTRAVSAGLQGKFCDSPFITAWQRPLLKGLGQLPEGVARFLIPRFQSIAGLRPKSLEEFDLNSLTMTRLKDYAGLTGPFPAITLGAALGGASAHLALNLGGPFLPLAFVLTLRGGSLTGEVQTYFRRSADLADRITAGNPGLMSIQHYDPVHDGWVVRFANHIRLKLLELPRSYIDYIHRTLEPGGTIVYLDCGARWLRYRTGDRSIFQVGGWGGIPAEEYLKGSERLERYCHSSGLRHCDWRLAGYPLEWGPESEWGCEEAFGEDLESFCRKEGYRLIGIALPEPQDYSRLAFQAAAKALHEAGREPAGVLVETFTQFDATAAQMAGLLPLWLVFNTQDSLNFLKEMIPHFPEGKPVFFSPLATFSLTPDMVSWQEWTDALEGLDWRNIGARPSHYPADALALATWSAPLRSWAADHCQPERVLIRAEDLPALSIHNPLSSGIFGNL